MTQPVPRTVAVTFASAWPPGTAGTPQAPVTIWGTPSDDPDLTDPVPAAAVITAVPA